MTGFALLAQHAPALAWFLAVSVVLLATVWIGYVIFLRLVELRGRQAMRLKRLEIGESLGAQVREQAEPLTDAEEAFREEMTRHKRYVEREISRGRMPVP